MRLLAVLVLLLVAAWCGFGLAASFEPGVDTAWRVRYGGALLALAAALFLLLRPRACGRAGTSGT